MRAKFLMTLVLLITSFGLWAGEGIQGQYGHEKEVSVFSENSSTCEDDGGKWKMDEEACHFEAKDKVIIRKKGSQFQLQISTIGSNFHTCEFVAPAKLLGSSLIATKMSEEYDPRSGQLIEVQCEVKATVENNHLEITTNQHCQSFCGANAGLDVKRLTKENK